MVSVGSIVNISATSTCENSALQILKGIAKDGRTEYRVASLLSNIGVSFASNYDATASIMKILIDAQANADVSVYAPKAVAHAYTAMGNDRIVLDADTVSGVGAGAGNDTVSIKTRGAAGSQVGHDTSVSNVDGDAGDDFISVDSVGAVWAIAGDDGNDTIAITSQSDVANTQGGAGDDSIVIASEGAVRGVAGDLSLNPEGKDNILISAGSAERILGGGGDDTIRIAANLIKFVMGGRGDDHIILNNTGNEAATLRMNIGDGRDVVETDSSLEISRNRVGSYLDNLSDMSTATVTRNNDNSLTISFADSDDQMIVRFTGAMAEAKNIVVEHDEANGTLLIRAPKNEPSSTDLSLARW